MEFKLDQNEIKLKRREYLLSAAFISIILIIGTVGIIGQKPSIERSIAAAAFAALFGFFIRHLFKDFADTKHKMMAHRLIIDNHQLILKQGEVKQEFDLKDIYSLHFKLKKGSVNSIILDIEKGAGFQIRGYEKMDEIMRLLNQSVPSSKLIKKRRFLQNR